MTISAVPAKVQEPILFRLALKLVLREVRKHPHTLLVKTLDALSGNGPVPPEAPWLYRLALELMISEAQLRPHTLLARAIRELIAAGEQAGVPKGSFTANLEEGQGHDA